jgi:hypothetical protein
MESLVRALSRLLLLALGLVFVASLVAAATLVFVAWTLRALWARLRGRPVAPWVFQFNPRWARFQAAAPSAPTNQAASPQRANPPEIADITDVVPKERRTDEDSGAAK